MVRRKRSKSQTRTDAAAKRRLAAPESGKSGPCLVNIRRRRSRFAQKPACSGGEPPCYQHLLEALTAERAICFGNEASAFCLQDPRLSCSNLSWQAGSKQNQAEHSGVEAHVYEPVGVLRVASPRSESFKLTHYDPTCSFRVPTTFTASADQFREQWEGHLQLLSKLSLDASESP